MTVEQFSQCLGRRVVFFNDDEEDTDDRLIAQIEKYGQALIMIFKHNINIQFAIHFESAGVARIILQDSVSKKRCSIIIGITGASRYTEVNHDFTIKVIPKMFSHNEICQKIVEYFSEPTINSFTVNTSTI